MLSTEELVLLSLALQADPRELLAGGDGDVLLGETVIAERSTVRRRFSDEWIDAAIETPADDAIRQYMRRGVDVLDEHGILAEVLWPSATPEQAREAVVDVWGESERKAARRIGVTPEAVSLTAHSRWGMGLTDERERRLAERVRDRTVRRSVQAMRGHITRQLVDEIEPIIRKALLGEEDGTR